MPLSLNNTPNLGVVPSASEVISKFLREAIIAGQLVEDEPIRQDEIAGLFNVSKIPVREALKQLEAEGLVKFLRNRGAVVTRISEPELAQIFEVRVLLEGQVMRLAVPNMTPELLDRAEAICDEFRHDSDAAKWAQLNWAFHACLYEAAQRPFMLNLIRSLNDKIERYLRLQMTIGAEKERAYAEHREIIEVCRSGDAERAARLVETHIEGVCRALYEYLPGVAKKAE